MSFANIKYLIINLPRIYKRCLVVFLDFAICAWSTWMAFGLRTDGWWLPKGNGWVVLAAALIILFPLFIYFGIYRAIFRYIGSSAFVSMAKVFAIYTSLFILIFVIFGVEGVPRSIGIIQPILLFTAIGWSRFLIRFFLGSDGFIRKISIAKTPHALIYGAGSAGRQLAAALAINKETIVKGFIDDDINLQRNTINGITVYPPSKVNRLILEFGITDVLLAVPSIDQTRRGEIISSLSGCGVRVRTLPGLMDIASGRITISDIHDLDINDLLGRKIVPPDLRLLEKNIKGGNILVTGAGGSIGSELCRQIIKFSPNSLVLVDISEHSLYLIYEELKRLTADDQINFSHRKHAISIVPCLTSVRNYEDILRIFKAYTPSVVFHAAAYKHVPLVEKNPAEGIRNNVFGTLASAQAALESGVTNFVLVSTDKAVRPTNVMGASKRIAELVLQSLSDLAVGQNLKTKFSMVRFGNVLGSSGSVAPLFSSQIKAGGPITLTHPEVTRYFMTIPEAAQLVIQSTSMTTGGEVFVLDMGEPVRIYDLAIRMIYLSGQMVKDELHPHGDIEIKVTGLRPGEKLYEELLIGENPQPTDHPKIMKAHEEFLSWSELQSELERLNLALNAADAGMIKEVLKKLVPGYKSNNDLSNLY